MDIQSLLRQAVERKASDLHITPKSVPLLRIHGELVPISDQKLSAENTRSMVYSLLTDRQKQWFEEKRSIDIAYSLTDTSRFRINAYSQREMITAAFRLLPSKVLSLEELGLPETISRLSHIRDGLVLVTGPTGCGKSTTLATLIDAINSTRSCNIITIEDPIEFEHTHKKSIVNQREVHTDVDSFAEAMRYILREDPDVVLVGEMRDLDTIRTAITAAETGHLVFSTLHTRDAVSTIARIVGVFSPEEQQNIRHQLSESLKAVVSQRLIKTVDGDGRKPASEVMVVTPAISNLIRSSKTEQIYSMIETGSKHGMQTMEQSLYHLVKKGHIDRDTALKTANNTRSLSRRLP